MGIVSKFSRYVLLISFFNTPIIIPLSKPRLERFSEFTHVAFVVWLLPLPTLHFSNLDHVMNSVPAHLIEFKRVSSRQYGFLGLIFRGCLTCWWMLTMTRNFNCLKEIKNLFQSIGATAFGKTCLKGVPQTTSQRQSVSTYMQSTWHC